MATLALFVCLLPAGLLAGPLKLQIDSKEAAINESFEVTVQVNGRHALLRLPETDDFEILDGTDHFSQPMFCMNMGLEVISGPCIFRFFFSPKKAGELTLPSFLLVDNFWNPGKLLAKTEPVALTVTPDKAANPRGPKQRQARRTPRGRRQPRQVQPQSNGPELMPEAQEPKRPSDLRKLQDFAQYDLFLVPTVEKDAYTLNEPFVVDFILYLSDQSGATSLQGLELPELEGFRKERLEVEESEQGKVRIGRRVYSRYLLSRYVLLPMEPGNRIVSAARATVMASVSTVQQFGGGGFSISVRGGSQPLEVVAPPLLLEIKEAPQPAPAGFDAANVGQFRLEKVEPPGSQPAGSWMVLKYRLTGSGNLLSVQVPKVRGGPPVETRAPHLDNSGVTIDSQGIHGSLEVQLPFRVTRAGEHALEPLRLVYFDPTAQRYQELSVPLEPIIAQAPKDESGQVVPLDSSDLEGIVTEQALSVPEVSHPGETARRLLFVLSCLLGIYLLALVARTVVRTLNRDPARRRRNAAMAAARRELGSAGKHLAANRTDQFYAALSRALGGYLEGRFGLSAASATHDAIERGLREQGVEETLARQFREELESAEYGRFAPTSVLGGDMNASLKRVRELMGRLDRVRGRNAR
jgi:hypothetical protein